MGFPILESILNQDPDNFYRPFWWISHVLIAQDILEKYACARAAEDTMMANGHYNDVIMGAIASQITSLTIVYSIVYSDADQRKHQSSASLAFVRGIHRWIPCKMVSYAENVSIWWRHHGSAVGMLDWHLRDSFLLLIARWLTQMISFDEDETLYRNSFGV